MPEAVCGAFRTGIAGMDQGHIEGTVLQGYHPLGTVAPNKASIFSDVDMRERVPPPESFGIAEGTSSQPWPVLMEVYVLPCLMGGRVVKEQPVKATDVAVL